MATETEFSDFVVTDFGLEFSDSGLDGGRFCVVLRVVGLELVVLGKLQSNFNDSITSHCAETSAARAYNE
jgi:hypothetical protein